MIGTAKVFFTIALFTAISSAYGQFAVINGRDGFTNVRESKNTRARIVSRIFNNNFFLYSFDPVDKDWVQVNFNVVLHDASPKERAYYRGTDLDTLHISGFILKGRTLPLDSMPSMMKAVTQNSSKDQIQLRNDSLLLTIKSKSFVEAEHKITRDANGSVTKIDGQIPAGIDGDLPKKQISAIELSIHGRPIKIPLEAYKNLYEPNFLTLKVINGKNGYKFVYMPSNSDGAGGYSVAWLFYKNRFVKRYIDAL